MSGKVNKSASDKRGTAREKKAVEATQDPTVQTQPASVAPVITDDGQASQPAVTASHVATDPQPDAGLTTSGVAATSFGSEEHLNSVQNEMLTLQQHDHDRAFRTAGDVVILEVRAIPKEGFHRAGRFWPHHGVSVFVSDNPDELVLKDDEGKLIHGCVISTADAKRLLAEKMLVVQEQETVTESGAEDA